MKALRNIQFIRIISFILSIHFLNISIDAGDRVPTTLPEELSFNKIESLTELILETFLNIENAIPESQDDDAGEEESLKFKELKFISPYIILIGSTVISRFELFFKFIKEFLKEIYFATSSPPPRSPFYLLLNI